MDTQRLQAADVIIGGDADRIRGQLLHAWNGQREPARQAARVVQQGPGLLGLRRGAVTRAAADLSAWAETWPPYVATLPADPRALAEYAQGPDDHRALWRAFDAAAHRTAEQAHPEHATLQATAAAARDAHQQAAHAMEEAQLEQTKMIGRFGGIALTPDPAGQLADLDRHLATTSQQLTDARARIATLTAEPALLGQPAGRLARERHTWRAQEAEKLAHRQAAWSTPDPSAHTPRPEDLRYLTPRHGRGR